LIEEATRRVRVGTDVFGEAARAADDAHRQIIGHWHNGCLEHR
jgi:hypothetical protein